MGILLAVYCVFIVCASVSGGWLPTVVRMTHLRTQVMMSFVAGLMLGIAMLHMLPHAAELLGSAYWADVAGLGGVIAMFLLLRAFHTHQHSEIACPVEPESSPPQTLDRHAVAEVSNNAGDDHGHDGHGHDDHGHDDHGHPGHGREHHTHDHVHTHSCDHDSPSRGLGWLGMLFGLGLHTMMDGVALAASVFADWHPNTFLGLAGLGTFLAVALHKPLDAFAITSVMQRSGWPIGQRNFVNLLFSLACPLGAFLFYFGAKQLSGGDTVLGWGLAVSAGFFICIALSDLLPEVSFHDHDRGKLTAALFAGVLLAVAIESLPGHAHDHGDHGQPDVVGNVVDQ